MLRILTLLLLACPVSAEMSFGNRVRRSSDTMTGPLDINGVDGSGYSLKLASGMYSGGMSRSTGTITGFILGLSGSNFFSGGCSNNQYVSTITARGEIQCGNDTIPVDGDSVIGNEVTNTANTTLTRSGAGNLVNPYLLALNLNSTNTWTAAINTLSTVTVGSQDSSGHSLRLSSGITAANGTFLADAVRINQIRKTDDGAFFKDPCLTDGTEAVTAVGNDGGLTCTPILDITETNTFTQPKTFTSTVTIQGQDSSGFSLKLSSGITSPLGVFVSTSVNTERLLKQSGSKFFTGLPCSAGFVNDIDATGKATCDTPAAAFDADTCQGNEVTNATDATLTRSGTGVGGATCTTGTEYTLGVNLASTNTWTAPTTFIAGVNIASTVVDGVSFDAGGNMTFLTESDYLVPTTRFAFRAAAAPCAGMRFDANANGGFNLTNTTCTGTLGAGFRVFSVQTTGETRIGPLQTGFISTFTTTGGLNLATDGDLTLSGASAFATFPASVTANGLLTAAGLVANSITISSGSAIRNWFVGNFTADAPSVAANTTLNHSGAVTGLNVGDICSIVAPALEANLSVSVSSASAGILTFRLNNPSILAINPASQDYRYFCVRP